LVVKDDNIEGIVIFGDSIFDVTVVERIVVGAWEYSINTNFLGFFTKFVFNFGIFGNFNDGINDIELGHN